MVERACLSLYLQISTSSSKFQNDVFLANYKQWYAFHILEQFLESCVFKNHNCMTYVYIEIGNFW